MSPALPFPFDEPRVRIHSFVQRTVAWLALPCVMCFGGERHPEQLSPVGIRL
jgi:hypothetical protein